MSDTMKTTIIAASAAALGACAGCLMAKKMYGNKAAKNNKEESVPESLSDVFIFRNIFGRGLVGELKDILASTHSSLFHPTWHPTPDVNWNRHSLS